MTSPTKSPNPDNSNSAFEPLFITKLFASGMFSGYSPVASGTVGSIVGLLFYCIPGFESPLVICIVIIMTFIIGIKLSGIMEKRYGHDPAEVTIDEIVGMWLSFFILPKKLIVILAAFIIFRFLDIIKPFPARRFDNMNGGLGIMMDDVVAGIYTNIIVRLLILIPWTGTIFK